MKQPRYWGSMFSLKVLNAYDAGVLTYNAESIIKWHDEFNAPLGTEVTDIARVRRIIDYYKEGNDLPNRMALQKAIEIQEKAKAAAENSGTEHEVTLYAEVRCTLKISASSREEAKELVKARLATEGPDMFKGQDMEFTALKVLP